jgi:hypothetical protein
MEKPELLCHSLIQNRKYFIVLSLLDDNFLSLYWDSKLVAAADPWKIHGLAYVINSCYWPRRSIPALLGYEVLRLIAGYQYNIFSVKINIRICSELFLHVSVSRWIWIHVHLSSLTGYGFAGCQHETNKRICTTDTHKVLMFEIMFTITQVWTH